jgi:hypothetical protein
MPTPCTVTGTLQTLTSGKIAQGKVIFQLTNIGTGNPIGISGTSIIPALTYTAMTAQDGTFTLPLWGNDNITPANTLYNVTFRDFQGNEIGPVSYSIVGASANLNTLTAAGGTTPPVISPNAPPVYSSNGTQQITPHIVQDTVTLLGGTAVVGLTGAAVFTSASSYSCVAQDDTGQNAVQVTQTSGSSITFTGTGTHVIRYICVGN